MTYSALHCQSAVVRTHHSVHACVWECVCVCETAIRELRISYTDNDLTWGSGRFPPLFHLPSTSQRLEGTVGLTIRFLCDIRQGSCAASKLPVLWEGSEEDVWREGKYCKRKVRRRRERIIILESEQQAFAFVVKKSKAFTHNNGQFLWWC